MTGARVDQEYWDHNWATTALPEVVDPTVPGLRRYVERRFHEYFRKALSGVALPGRRLLEIGCARSAWLPYFAREFDLSVVGLDASEIGCRQARDLLRRAGVSGEIVVADFFAPPDWTVKAFDVVVSFGVAEHFTDTAGCLSAFARFLKPDGLMITVIPNMSGLVGLVERVVNRPVYDIHVPLTREALGAAHEAAGLEVLDCRYFVSTHFGICNLNGLSRRGVGWLVKRSALACLSQISKAVWFVEERVGPFAATRVTAGYVTCLARCPASPAGK